MATVLDRLEQLVREVIGALRENSELLGRVYTVLDRTEKRLDDLDQNADLANRLSSEANDIAKADADSASITRSAYRDALKNASTVVGGWLNTPYAGIIAVTFANVVLAWTAHWMGVSLPFLPSPSGVPHVIVPVSGTSGG